MLLRIVVTLPCPWSAGSWLRLVADWVEELPPPPLAPNSALLPSQRTTVLKVERRRKKENGVLYATNRSVVLNQSELHMYQATRPDKSLKDAHTQTAHIMELPARMC